MILSVGGIGKDKKKPAFAGLLRKVDGLYIRPSSAKEK